MGLRARRLRCGGAADQTQLVDTFHHSGARVQTTDAAPWLACSIQQSDPQLGRIFVQLA
jgi:hypothetical protein